MIDKKTMELIETVARAAAQATIEAITETRQKKRRHVMPESAKKTEQLLQMYNRLPDTHPARARVDAAIDAVKTSGTFGAENADIILSHYIDGMGFAELSEIYDCQYNTIVRRKNRLLEMLAVELFPEDVLAERRLL